MSPVSIRCLPPLRILLKTYLSGGSFFVLLFGLHDRVSGSINNRSEEMTEVKNQHYVPQSYLRRFCSIDERLSVFDKEDKKQFSTTTRNVGSEKFFYRSELNGSDQTDQTIEKYLSSIEGATTQVTNELLAEFENSTYIKIKADQKETLATFIAIQFIRTREKRTQLNAILQTILTQIGKEHLRIKGYKDTDFSLQIDVPKLQGELLLDKATIDDYSQTLLSHYWVFHKNLTSSVFFTSDNPVTLSGERCNPMRGVGLATKGVSIVLPLSPRFQVVLFEKTTYPELSCADCNLFDLGSKDNIDYYNSLQVINSYRYIYSIDNDFSLVESMLNSHPALGDKGRQRVAGNAFGREFCAFWR